MVYIKFFYEACNLISYKKLTLISRPVDTERKGCRLGHASVRFGIRFQFLQSCDDPPWLRLVP